MDMSTADHPLRPYPSWDELHALLLDLGATSYGTSVEGRPLLRVDRGAEGPVVLLTAGLHGLEYIGVQVALEVLRAPPPGVRLVCCPVLNPDGYARTWAHSGEGTVGSMRKNARGVDLNRNFPLPWSANRTRIPFAGSEAPEAATYCGPHPLSEPETRALAGLVRAHPPHAALGLHSFMGTQIPARTWFPSDWRGYTRLCRAFRRGQGSFIGYPRLATPLGDVFTGELEDWLHHAQGCWAVCIESFSVAESLRQHLRAPTVFWRFNPRTPDTIVARDAAGVREWLLEAAAMEPVPSRPGANPLGSATRAERVVD